MRFFCVFVLALLVSACAQPDDPVRIAGSSTVFPFSRTVAERFAEKTSTRAPIVEMTGTGGGLRLFCAGDSAIQIANASREIKESERELCARNGVDEIFEFRIGYDGIVVAAARENPLNELTLTQLYRGLAKDLPKGSGFEPNPNETWADVDPALPPIPIEAHGPPPTSGTRDAFVELALQAGARADPKLAKLEELDPNAFASRAGALREDGAWIDEGENDNAIIQIIRSSPHALGVFGYSFYDQNRTLVDGVEIDGALPSFEAIADGRYALARSLFFYVAPDRADEAVAEYVLEFTSEAALGPYGYLTEKGLVPLPEEARRKERAKAAALTRRATAMGKDERSDQ